MLPTKPLFAWGCSIPKSSTPAILMPAILLAAAMLLPPTPASAADHREAPLFRPLGSTASGGDINDLYVFQSPENPDNTVLIMTANPFAGMLGPATFDTKIRYELNVDNDGDFVADLAFVFQFANNERAGRQTGMVSVRFPDSANSGDDGSQDPVGFAVENSPSFTAIGRFQFGLFDDPFFFDLHGLSNGLQFIGTDYFAGANVSAIVLEVPSAALTSSDSKIAIWATTTRTENARIVQLDRMGRPAINTMLIPPGEKDAFNLGSPSTDVRVFRESVMETLLTLGNTKAGANALADLLLPDVLTFDTEMAAGFPNGRALSDDVIDIELNVFTDGAVTTDGVDRNDVMFRDVFPYLGKAQ